MEYNQVLVLLGGSACEIVFSGRFEPDQETREPEDDLYPSCGRKVTRVSRYEGGRVVEKGVKLNFVPHVTQTGSSEDHSVPC